MFDDNAIPSARIFLNRTNDFLEIEQKLKMMNVSVDMWLQEMKEKFRRLMKLCGKTDVWGFEWSLRWWTLKNG